MVGYAMGFFRLTDLVKWKDYASKAGPASRNYGSVMVAGGTINDVAAYKENKDDHYHFIVLLEFPDADKAKEFYTSEEYQSKLRPIRHQAAQGPFAVVEGIERPKDKKGIMIAAIRVTNPEKLKQYDPSASVALYDGAVLFKSKEPVMSDEFEGQFDIIVALAFPSAERAVAWVNSSEYKEMLDIRLSSSEGPFVILDAGSPPTPSTSADK